MEQKDIALEAEGGRYIRPIVVFQAQPKTADDNITFDKIKKQLIDIEILYEQIKIKTANKDEINNTDLLSRDCPVHYIITVNALKEGWDCPFAYILASLANKSSRVDVEQILGRVLRLPYTTKHRDDLLNLSYVFTSSADFRATIENIIDSLNRAGLSKKDYRVAEIAPTEAQPQSGDQIGLFDNPEEQTEQFAAPIAGETEDLPEIDTEAIKEAISNPTHKTTTELETFAQQESEKYYKQMKTAANHDDGIPNDIKGMTDQYPIKEFFREEASKIVLPVFVRRVNQGCTTECGRFRRN